MDEILALEASVRPYPEVNVARRRHRRGYSPCPGTSGGTEKRRERSEVWYGLAVRVGTGSRAIRTAGKHVGASPTGSAPAPRFRPVAAQEAALRVLLHRYT